MASYRAVLGWEPWAAQEELGRAALQHPLLAVASANNMGKDAWAAHHALYLIYAEGFNLVILTGVSERQVKHSLMAELRRAWLRARDLPGQLYDMELRIGGVPRVLAFVSSDESRLVGFHRPKMAYFVTEAQGCPPFVFESILANVGGADSRVVIYGNPTRRDCEFYTLYHQDDWHSISIPASRHPNVVTGQEVIPGGITREQVERLARRYGRDGAVYRARVEAQWPETDVSDLFVEAWLERANELWRARQAEGWTGGVRCAVDVSWASSGDRCALAVGQGPVAGPG